MAGGRFVGAYDVAQVVEMIAAAAAAGEPCPSNAAICGRLGYASVSTAARMLQMAESHGLVTVERGLSARVVSAADGSWRTSGETGRPHWSVVGIGTHVAAKAPRKARKSPRPPKALPAREQAPPRVLTDAERAIAAQIAASRAAHLNTIHSTPQPGGTPSPLPRVAPSGPAAASGHLHRTCQWPTGDRSTGGITFECSDATREGSSYCAVHHRRAYEPVPQRKLAA